MTLMNKEGLDLAATPTEFGTRSRIARLLLVALVPAVLGIGPSPSDLDRFLRRDADPSRAVQAGIFIFVPSSQKARRSSPPRAPRGSDVGQQDFICGVMGVLFLTVPFVLQRLEAAHGPDSAPDGSVVTLMSDAKAAPPSFEKTCCPVCKTQEDSPLVTCASCDTPHHAECWIYAGGCSLFACRSDPDQGHPWA